MNEWYESSEPDESTHGPTDAPNDTTPCTLPDVPAAMDDPPVELNRRRPPGKAPTLEESVAAHPSNPRPRPTTDSDGQGDAA
jgi:hypothetical protein